MLVLGHSRTSELTSLYAINKLQLHKMENLLSQHDHELRERLQEQQLDFQFFGLRCLYSEFQYFMRAFELFSAVLLYYMGMLFADGLPLYSHVNSTCRTLCVFGIPVSLTPVDCIPRNTILFFR
jgi:hypothetical protein